MDNYRIKLTCRAVRDLERIYTYIADDLSEPETALALAGRIEQLGIPPAAFN